MKSTVKFFLWATFMTLSKAIVGEEAVPWAETAYHLSLRARVRVWQTIISIYPNSNDDCGKY